MSGNDKRSFLRQSWLILLEGGRKEKQEVGIYESDKLFVERSNRTQSTFANKARAVVELVNFDVENLFCRFLTKEC